jgi:hypothetical protein
MSWDVSGTRGVNPKRGVSMYMFDCQGIGTMGISLVGIEGRGRLERWE